MSIEQERLAELTAAIVAQKITEEKTLTDNRVKLLQYINTGILTFIGIVAMMIFVTANNVKTAQTDMSKELVRMKTIQDINVSNVSQIDARVTALELNYLDYIKNWVESNFVRKAQVK